MLKSIHATSLIAILTIAAHPQAVALTQGESQEQKKSGATEQPKNSPSPPKYQRKKRASLMERSDILSNGTIWTIVPKTAIILKHPRHQSKIVTKPKGKFVNWQTFLNKNPAWLSTYPVDYKIATGESKISFENYEKLKRKGQIIVAVRNKNPISVIPSAIIKTAN